MDKQTIRIGTRKSKLALTQTELVKNRIAAFFPELNIELVPMSTQGDDQLDRALTSFGGKGVFTRELEEAILDGRIDFAVHSAKDMPISLPTGLTIGAVLERADPRDVFITTSGIAVKDLPAGSIIGTSSLRREIQIKQINPDVQINMLRGNVPTRLDKLAQGMYDGIILAAAGLERLRLLETTGFYFEFLDSQTFIPAPGQGILAIVSRQHEFNDILTAIHSVSTANLLVAERTFMTLLNAGCNAPCGAYCEETKTGLTMRVMYAKDGVHPFYQTKTTTDQINGAQLASQLAASVTCQKVSLVGAGPGDELLLTQKALHCIRTADVIIYDNLISPSLLNEAKMDAILIYAGKRSSAHHLPQQSIQEKLIHYAMQGQYVIRLKGGDPFIFGRGGEEALALAEHGIPFEIVPGISSSYSVPAYAGIPVTQRMMASSFHIITGHEGEHKSRSVIDYKVLANTEGTLVFLMGFQHLDQICEQLVINGKDPHTLACVIQHGTTGRQKTVTGTLENIVARSTAAEIKTPAIAVIGQVVSLHETLDWFNQKPLSGTRTLLTGTRKMIHQLKEVLDPLGTETIALSLIETIPLIQNGAIQALQNLSKYSWVVFTSTYGIDLFFQMLNQYQIDIRSLSQLKFAVIGSSCAETLKSYSIIADFVPPQFSSEEFANSWVPTLSSHDNILILRALEGSTALPDALSAAKIAFDDETIYQTLIDQRRAEELNRIIDDIDYVIVTSGSAVKAIRQMLDKPFILDNKLISIGPVTSAQLIASGFSEFQTASVYNQQGIADILLDDYIKKRNHHNII